MVGGGEALELLYYLSEYYHSNFVLFDGGFVSSLFRRFMKWSIWIWEVNETRWMGGSAPNVQDLGYQQPSCIEKGRGREDIWKTS